MAFVIANDLQYLNAVGGQSKAGSFDRKGAPAVWTYKTADTHATVDGAGYFNTIRDNLNLGDIIFVFVVTNRGATNEALSTMGMHVIKDKSDTAVDATNVTAISVIDSD